MKNKIVTFEQVRDMIVNIRGQQVIPDFAVAALYGVETREINQAVKNNPRKFPKGWLLVLDNQESAFLRSKFLMLDNKTGRGNYSKHNYKAFTDNEIVFRHFKQLATFLNGDRATDTTIVIIDTFAKLRELSQSIKEIANNPDKDQQKSLIQKSGVIMEDLFGEALSTSETETEIELNFAVLKLKHTIKRKKGETDL